MTWQLLQRCSSKYPWYLSVVCSSVVQCSP